MRRHDTDILGVDDVTSHVLDLYGQRGNLGATVARNPNRQDVEAPTTGA